MEISLLQFIKTRGVGVKTIERFCSFIRQHKIYLEALKGRHDVLFLKDQVGVKGNLAEAIVAKYDEARRERERLIENHIRMLWLGSDSYPTKLEDVLGSDAPPYLFVKGNIDVLNSDCVGVCGSRHASQRGIELAKDIAIKLANNGIGIVSGNATGVDIVSHESTLQNGGATVFVLPLGILNYRARPEIEALLSTKNHLIVSQFPPETMWFAHNAMARNSVIVAISNAMLVVEAGLSGGSLAAGEKAIELGNPLFAMKYSIPPESALGNDILIRKGAMPISQGDNGGLDLGPLIKRARQRMVRKSHIVQPSLFSSDAHPLLYHP